MISVALGGLLDLTAQVICTVIGLQLRGRDCTGQLERL